MSAAEGVPAWARPVLEKGLTVSHIMAMPSEYDHDQKRDAWESLYLAIRAALASDAGTPEGERTVMPESAINPAWTTMQAHEEGFRASMAVPAPLDESGAAAPDAELDRELDRLLERLALSLYHDGRLFGEHQVATAALVKPGVLELRRAIHAHVAQVKREAREEERKRCAMVVEDAVEGRVMAESVRVMVETVTARIRGAAPLAPAPAPGDAITAHALIAPLIPYLKHDTNCGADDGLACICGKQKAEAEFKRLYRAATGEVVARGVLDRGSTGVYCRLEHIERPGWDVAGSAPVLLVLDTRRAGSGYYPADDCAASAPLVLRRDKEGV